jgi:hypothetical protein
VLAKCFCVGTNGGRRSPQCPKATGGWRRLAHFHLRFPRLARGLALFRRRFRLALVSSAPSSTGIDSTETGLVTLPPAFLEALRRVVPRRRRAKLPYVVGLGLLAVVGVLGMDGSTREFMAERWHRAPGVVLRAALPPQKAEPTKADRIVPPAATSDPRVDNPVAPVATAIESASATSATGTAAKPRTTRPHARDRSTRGGPQGT